MKKLRTAVLLLCLTASLTVGASAAEPLEYTIDAPDGPDYGTPTSVEVVHTVDGGARKNEDVSKNAALIPPAFGSPSADTKGTGTYLTPNLAPSGMAATGTVINGTGSPVVVPGSTMPGTSSGTVTSTGYPSTIHYILTNISYTGNMIWQKTCATDTFPFRQIRNTGQKPQYFVEDSHPAIVSQEDFQRVRELMARRREQFLSHAQRRPSVYSRRVFCGVCGSMCRRKDIRGKVYWVCHRHDQEKSRCPVPQVPEAEITSAVLRLYHKLAQDPARIFRPMAERLRELRELELRSNRKITDIDKEIARLSEQNLVLVRLKSKGYVDPALYLSQQDEITHKLKELKKLRRRALEASGEDQQLQNTEAILEYLEDSGRPFQRETVDEELFEFLIQRLTVYSAETVKFRLYNGLELAETMERAVR